MNHEPMSQEQLDAIRVRADSVTTLRRVMPGDWQRLAIHLSEDTDTLIAEVERLRALTTVDKAMVERGAFALARRKAEDPLAGDRVSGRTLLLDTKAVLNAALNPGEGS